MTLRVYYSDTFLKDAKKLGSKEQAKLSGLVVLLQENPYHPKLHTKPLSRELSGLYSFRITRDWRVLFKFISADEVMLVDVGNRRDIYK